MGTQERCQGVGSKKPSVTPPPGSAQDLLPHPELGGRTPLRTELSLGVNGCGPGQGPAQKAWTPWVPQPPSPPGGPRAGAGCSAAVCNDEHPSLQPWRMSTSDPLACVPETDAVPRTHPASALRFPPSREATPPRRPTCSTWSQEATPLLPDALRARRAAATHTAWAAVPTCSSRPPPGRCSVAPGPPV